MHSPEDQKTSFAPSWICLIVLAMFSPSVRSLIVTMPSTALAYRSRAVRALVLLHDEHVRRFLVVWNQAQAASVVLPKTDDPAYASLETLLRHVLGAARGYMTWMCEVLELPDPEIRIPPEPAALAGRSRQLHGARAGEMAHAAAGRRRRSARDAGVSIPMADAVLYRRDARARGHASDSACVPTRRADAPALSRRRDRAER